MLDEVHTPDPDEETEESGHEAEAPDICYVEPPRKVLKPTGKGPAVPLPPTDVKEEPTEAPTSKYIVTSAPAARSRVPNVAITTAPWRRNVSQTAPKLQPAPPNCPPAPSAYAAQGIAKPPPPPLPASAKAACPPAMAPPPLPSASERADATTSKGSPPAKASAKPTQAPARTLQAPWAPPAPPVGHMGMWPEEHVAKPFPPNIFLEQPGGPPPNPRPTEGPKLPLTRKEKNAQKPNRGSGRLGKWCMWQAKAKRAPIDVREAFYRMNPQPANSAEGHAFVPKMPSGRVWDLSQY